MCVYVSKVLYDIVSSVSRLMVLKNVKKKMQECKRGTGFVSVFDIILQLNDKHD